MNGSDDGAAAVGRSRRSSRAQAAELGVFLSLVVPSAVLSFFVLNQGSVGFVITAVATMTRDAALVSLILYFLWRNHERPAAVGLRWNRAGRDALLGAVLFVPFFFFTNFVDRFLLSLGLRTPSTPVPALTVSGSREMILAAALVLVVAFAEETIFRGYLILRLRAVTSSVTVAVVLSSCIFALGHGYEGTAGAATVGVMGVIFAVIYLWRGSLVAPMVMHFLQDFVAIVILPLAR